MNFSMSRHETIKIKGPESRTAFILFIRDIRWEVAVTSDPFCSRRKRFQYLLEDLVGPETFWK